MSDPSTPRRAASVLILAGPTASGKTELAIELALRYGAEIVGADSRQIYRDMPIGTAAPTAEQLRRVPHHCIGFVDPAQRYSAARYASDAMHAIREILGNGKRVIVTGGTGFYLRSLLGGVALAPQYDETLRARLAREAATHPPEFLFEWLALHDIQRAATLHPRDTYRVLRGLEVVLAHPSSAARDGSLPTLRDADAEVLLIVVDVPMDEIDRRIAARTERMLAAGLLEEAERVGEAAAAADAVGYPQALAHLRGWSTPGELRASLERATRRYARRQTTWFRTEPAALWLAPDAVDEAVREKLGWSAKRAG